MDPKFLIDLQGKAYILYGGILAQAHERGLQGIETTLIQIPTADNEHTAIVKAIVRMKDGGVFEEFGDANPRNVNARIATALLRMAATRAKGRALRDAVNVGEAMLEDLPGQEEEQTRRSSPPARTAGSTGTPPPPPSIEGFEASWQNPKGRTLARKDLLNAMLGLVADAKKLGVPCSVDDPLALPNADLYHIGVVLTAALQEARGKEETATK